jgi:hypothetical protein
MTSVKIRPLKVVILQEKRGKTVSIYLIFGRIVQLFQSNLTRISQKL